MKWISCLCSHIIKLLHCSQRSLPLLILMASVVWSGLVLHCIIYGINFADTVVTRCLNKMFYFLIMTFGIRRNTCTCIWNFIIRKVSHILSHHLSVFRTHSEITHVNKRSCFGHWLECHDCCLKIVTVGSTHWEKNYNLKLFDVCSKKCTIIHREFIVINIY